MKKNIKVRCMSEFKIYNHDESELIAEVEEKEYIAELYKETDEYFAKDSEGREFFVGEINIDEQLILVEDFELVEV
jgi:hypothetical protein